MATWGGIAVNDLKRWHGDQTYNSLRRHGFIETVDTEDGKVAYLSRPGRRRAGLTNEYHPTPSALLNNVTLRRAVRVLEGEDFTNVVPKFYGGAHPQLTDPQGRLVCVTARHQSFRARAMRLLMDALFKSGDFPDLDRLIVFHPSTKHVKHLEEKYPGKLEIRPSPPAA